MPLDRVEACVLEFQAVSYAWGVGGPTYVVFVSNIPRPKEDALGQDDIMTNAVESTRHFPLLARKNLYMALKNIRRTEGYSWVWIDALSIDQMNASEKSL